MTPSFLILRRTSLFLSALLAIGSFNIYPSAALNESGDATLSLSASSASVVVGDTASVTVTTSFTSNMGSATFNGGRGPDSAIVYIVGTGFGGNVVIRPTQDTVNAVTARGGNGRLNTGIGTGWNGVDNNGVDTPLVGVGVLGGGSETVLANSANTTFSWRGDSINAVTRGSYTKAAYTYYFQTSASSAVGTYTYTFSLRDKKADTIYKSATFTLTVTAGDATGTTATKLWLHKTLYSNMSVNTNLGTPTADSSIVANAGAAATPTAVGYLVPQFFNAAGETYNSTSGVLVTESITVVVSGPGLLGLYAGNGRTSQASTYTKSVTASLYDTIIVYSDGTAGTGTFTGSIGGVNLTQAAKTITFVGKPASFTVTSDSPIVSTAATAYQAISFVVKDSAGNAIDSTNTQYNTGTPGAFYALVSDTTVVGGTAVVSTGTAAFTACSYNSARLRWFCDLSITDSGTATITIADSKLASNAVVTATATIGVAGAAWTGTMALDKATYSPGELMILTLTAKDSGGRNVVNGAANPFSTTLTWNTTPTFTYTVGSNAAGGTFGTGASYASMEGYIVSGTTYVSGVDTATAYAPTRAGTYTLTTTTKKSAANGGQAETVTLTFKVVDAVADAAATATNKAIADAQSAADAATDAALQAIDAANAATDAANLAAEAADAATVAAEEAKDAADAATAAVEALATQVATLMAALQAQVRSLANTVAKIAKKVKA